MAAQRVLKLYVWEGILTDWYSGMAVAVAPDLRAAKNAVRKAHGQPSPWLESDLKTTAPVVIRLDQLDPATALAWTVSGGG